jgi:tetratricopeptide (TPR) repeat protein
VSLKLVMMLAGLGLISGVRAERYALAADPGSAEGQYLNLIGLQSTVQEKIALLDRFTRNHPKHASIPWVYEQLQIALIEVNELDRAIATGQKLIEICPDDLEAARRNQKAAELKGNREEVERWNNHAIRVAQKIVESASPKDPGALELWNEAAALAAPVAAQGEYKLYQQAAAAASPRERIRLLDELRKRNPEGAYLPQALVLYMQDYRVLGDRQQALEYAERVLANDDQNEDAVLVAAEEYFERKSPKGVRYAAKLIALMRNKPRPAAVSDAEWAKKRIDYTGAATWIVGAAYISNSQFADAERTLRQALACFKESDHRVARVLFYLGWANYKLGNLDEALRFYKQCSAMKSEFQEQASKNLQAISNERRPSGV